MFTEGESWFCGSAIVQDVTKAYFYFLKSLTVWFYMRKTGILKFTILPLKSNEIYKCFVFIWINTESYYHFHASIK